MGRRFPLGAFALAASLAGGWLFAGCFSTGEGPEPPGDQLYFPVGLVVSPSGKALYAANSDFDLQYNAGTVQVYDLDRVRQAVPRVWDRPIDGSANDACGPLLHATVPTLFPGPCNPIVAEAPQNAPGGSSASLIADSVQIGAFATDLVYVDRPGAKPDTWSGARLFVPVRGDPSVTFIDLDDDRKGPPRLRCGQEGNAGRCDGAHKIGVDSSTNSRDLLLPVEPFGITASEDADALLVTHQTTGEVSLITGCVGSACATSPGSLLDSTPVLQFLLSGLSYAASGITPVPVPAWVREASAGGSLFPYQPGFLVSFRSAAEIDLVRYYDDRQSSPTRPFLSRAGGTSITVAASGVDSRGIVVDAEPRRTCEAACPAAPDPSRLACLQGCAGVPMPVYVANRAPAQLLIGETRTNVSPTGSNDLVSFYDAVPLSFGASRVVLGSVRGADGKPEKRVFVVCFDARLVFVYDPAARRITGTIRTGRGPYSFAIDPPSRATRPEGTTGAPEDGYYAYVGHFTDSYIGVVDLDESHAATFQTIVATLGLPRVPRTSK